MLAPILAAIIIILLIIYAAFPFLSNQHFKGWANIALTSLILFTVIVTLFVILGNRKGQTITLRSIPTMAEEAATREQEKQEKQSVAQEQTQEEASAEDQKPVAQKVDADEISDEEALMAIAKEYLEAEEAFKAQGDKDYQQKAAQQIIDRYDFTQEDWQTFLEDAARYDLFNKAKAEMNK